MLNNKEISEKLAVVLSAYATGALVGYSVKSKKLNKSAYRKGYSAGTRRVVKDIVKADTNDDIIVIDGVSYYRKDKMMQETKDDLTKEVELKYKSDAMEDLRKILSKEAVEQIKNESIEEFKKELEKDIRAKVEKEHEMNEEELKLEQTKAVCKAGLTAGVVGIAALATILNGSGSSYDFRKISESLEKLYKTVNL